MSINHPVCLKTTDLENIINKVKDTYSKYFDQLIDRLKINVEQNKKYASQYHLLLNQKYKIEKSIKIKNVFKWVLIIFLIFPFFVLNNKVKQHKEDLKIIEHDLLKEKKKLDNQLKPLLNGLSSFNIYKNVLEKVLINFTFSRTISLNESNVWEEIGHSLSIKQTQTFTNLITGKFNTHPFLLFELKEQKWTEVAYSESETIEWYDSEGNEQFEELTATVYWPFPVYESNNYFAYKSNIAQNLTFSNCESLNSKRKIKKYYKNTNQQYMDNDEFDLLFPTKRNDELQFRVIFTVLTQENFVNLIKSIKPFKIFKNGLFTITYFPIEIPHNIFKNMDLNLFAKDINYDFNCFNENDSYNLDLFKQQKMRDISTFVEKFCMLQLPIANMPVYLREEYYDLSSENATNPYYIQHEVFANILLNKMNLNKYPTNIIIHNNQILNFEFNNKNCFLDEIYVNYFVPISKIIPTPVHGSHGSTIIDVEVQDFQPRVDKYYLFVGYGFDSNIDLYEIPTEQILNGIYFKIYSNKPEKNELINQLKSLNL